jgi:hypothetical protein
MLFMNPEKYYGAIFKYVAQINKYFLQNFILSALLVGRTFLHHVGLTFLVNSFPDVQGIKIFVLTSHLFLNMIMRSLKNCCKQTLTTSR